MPTSAARTAARESSAPCWAPPAPAPGAAAGSTGTGATPRSATSARTATTAFTATAIQMVTVTPIAGTRKNPASAVPVTAPQVFTA